MKLFLGLLATFLPLITMAQQKEGPLVDLKRGQTYPIILDSNPTTGYSWNIKKISSDASEKNPAIKIIKKGYEKTKTNLVGAGGRQYWIVKAIRKGNAHIILHYERPWEKDTEPAQVKEFIITVK